MSARQIAVSRLIETCTRRVHRWSAVGFAGATNKGFLFIRMKDRKQRGSLMETIMGRLRAATATIPGIRTIPDAGAEFRSGRRIARAKYQYTLQSGDIDRLSAKAAGKGAATAELPALRDVNSDPQISNPQLRVDIDCDKAAAFGLFFDSRACVYNAYGTRQISTIFTEADDYQVILEAGDDFQNDPGALVLIWVSTRGRTARFRR